MSVRSFVAVSTLALTLALPGCDEPVEYNGSYRGYSVKVLSRGRNYSRMVLFVPCSGEGVDPQQNSPRINAEDVDGDGKFDKIHINNIPFGHPLEKLANLDELHAAWDTVRSQ